MTQPKTAILFLNLGGPDSLEAVKPFLYNLFADPDIIKLPLSTLFQKPLAWWIATTRAEEARHNYAQMGGASPILPLTREQGAALRACLQARGAGDFQVYIAMRYWHPFTEEAVAAMAADGVEEVIVLPLYPHYSHTTTGSSLNELKRVMAARNLRWPLWVVDPYYGQADYQQAVAETIRQGLDGHAWGCEPGQVRLLFSAHSLPLRHVKRTRDPYPEQIHACCRQIAETHFPGHPWDLSYQSKVGRMPWLGPDTDGVLHYYAGQHIDNVLMVPISFVSDHVETLVEIDKLYVPLAAELGLKHCHRAPALNSLPAFIECLANRVTEQLALRAEKARPTFMQLIDAAQASGS